MDLPRVWKRVVSDYCSLSMPKRKRMGDNMQDVIYRQVAIDAMCAACWDWCDEGVCKRVSAIQEIPSAQPKIIHCKDCKHWRQNTNYQGVPLSFGFCESDDMWRSLYGETYDVSHIDTDDDFYCGYAERRTDE